MRRGLLVALAVVAAVNLGVMVDVLRDRAGEPDAVVTVDERELALERAPREGSPITLRWRYQREGRPGGSAPHFLPPWIDQRMLEALGFDCSVPAGAPGAADHYRGVLPRLVVVAFEVGGPAWQARLQTWQDRSREEADRVSRLVPVDAGLDAASLRARYPDRQRYLLLHGLVRLFHDEGRDGTGPSLSGRIVEVVPAELSVPREAHAVLEGLGATGTAPVRGGTQLRFADRDSVERIAHAPRYTVRVEVGRLLHPRIVAVASAAPGR